MITMKYLLTGIAVAAAFALAAPVWAQGGGNPMGTPGPNPGGPGLTPYSTGNPSSATPPMHRQTRHHTMSKRGSKGPALSGDTTAQLNREELARVQSGNLSNPPAPPPAQGVPAPRGAGRMPVGGPKTD
jgi:hypothetical protein